MAGLPTSEPTRVREERFAPSERPLRFPSVSRVLEAPEAPHDSTVHDVAAYITERVAGAITGEKLCMLIFLVHGWSFGVFDRPAMRATFEAGPSGPVPVEVSALMLTPLVHDWPAGDSDRLPYESRRIVELVVERYASQTAKALADSKAFAFGAWFGFSADHVAVHDSDVRAHFRRLLAKVGPRELARMGAGRAAALEPSGGLSSSA